MRRKKIICLQARVNWNPNSCSDFNAERNINLIEKN